MAKSFTGMMPTAYSPAFLELFARNLHWEAWEQLIRQNGWTIDRPIAADTRFFRKSSTRSTTATLTARAAATANRSICSWDAATVAWWVPS